MVYYAARGCLATPCHLSFPDSIFDHLLCGLSGDKRVSLTIIIHHIIIINNVFVSGEMLKFLCICLTVALGVVLSIPMEMTTLRPEATTEDTSGRLLTLPDPVKCENSKYNPVQTLQNTL